MMSESIIFDYCKQGLSSKRVRTLFKFTLSDYKGKSQ